MFAQLTARFTLEFLIRVIRFIRGQPLLRCSPRLLIGAFELGPSNSSKLCLMGFAFAVSSISALSAPPRFSLIGVLDFPWQFRWGTLAKSSDH